MKRVLTGIVACVAWAAAAGAQAMAPAACPAEIKVEARCYAGADGRGGYFWIAIPAQWNRTLVVHTHGGPSMKAPTPDEPVSDLKRFALMVREGYAWAGSSYRHAGYGVQDAAEDTEALRALFWKEFGKPERTILHGQSWGANVALRVAERAAPGVYDGVLLTSGIVAGGDLAYDFRADLRAVYQYYCHNLPLASEPSSALWSAPLTSSEVQGKVNACLGTALPAEKRTAAQARALRNIARVVRIPESSVGAHMNWATVTFHDLTMRHLGGHNPFSNVGVVYAGSDDDAALNKLVPRFAATSEGRRRLKEDSGVSGKVTVPTLTLHAIDDPTVFVEMEHEYRAKVEQAGGGARLLQMFTREAEHGRLAAPQYAAVLASLMAWIRDGARPAPASVVQKCEAYVGKYGEACHFDLQYQPAPLATRVYARAWPAE
ncbi:alpha/beta hydrolase family protein [Zemynaea arenosa]|uniref:alpha/beta hydrolase family protein n=1 Tax=Zemynaea arenosa TaxID=2561931 RepID=UPI0014321399|nr:DUF6351 family protein [Massilia arenosa]